MLNYLSIDNIAIIESARIELTDGLNVLSGETGAGKSIIIDALSAVLGERTSKELIRTDASSAKVVAQFSKVSPDIKAVLAELELPETEDDTLLISRTINLDGRNVCKVNDTPVTVATLKKLGKNLISIHGQHDSQNLLNPEYHYKYLDALGGLEPEYSAYLKEYEGYSSLYRQFKQLESSVEERNRRIEYLQFEIKELEDAGITLGEYDKLLEQREGFRNSEKIISGFQKALSALSDGEEYSGAVTLGFAAANALEAPAKFGEEAAGLLARMNEAAYNLQDLKTGIENALYNANYSPEQQNMVEERIHFLHQLQSKYGATEEDMLSYLENAKEELDSLQHLSSNREEVLAELERRKETLLQAANTLHLARVHTASEFEVKVREELKFLDMPNVELSTSFEHCKLNPTGSDVIEFLISPNPGEALKPLAKIASGGELSRIMLAIQNVLSDKGNVATMIFDEIDTGVSGSAAEKIGIKLHEVAKKHQVICVTHSAQVASYAESHFKISKDVVGGKTYTKVDLLEEDGRVEELARIMGGVEITDLLRTTAKELLEHAKNL